jgi:hypothetical protein
MLAGYAKHQPTSAATHAATVSAITNLSAAKRGDACLILVPDPPRHAGRRAQ